MHKGSTVDMAFQAADINASLIIPPEATALLNDFVSNAHNISITVGS